MQVSKTNSLIISFGGAATNKDVGGSSKYSKDGLEDQSGKGFMRTAVGHGLVDLKQQGNPSII